MKLSNVYKINEGRKIIDSETIGARKVAVLENPSPKSVVDELDRIQDTLGGWIYGKNVWIWNRYLASHYHIARTMGIEPENAIAFYIVPEKEKINGQLVVTDATFEVSEFSGSKSFKALMNSSYINGIMRILAERKRNDEPEDDYSELLGSLNSRDY